VFRGTNHGINAMKQTHLARNLETVVEAVKSMHTFTQNILTLLFFSATVWNFLFLQLLLMKRT